MPAFDLHSDFQPTGDQPQAIEKLSHGLKSSQQLPDVVGRYWDR